VAGAQTADEQAQPSASERAQQGDERAQRGDERAQQADEQGQPTGEQAQPTNQQAQPTDEQAQRADEEKLRQIINEQGPEPAAGGEAPRVPNRVFRELVDSEKPHGTATEKPQEPASDEPRETPSERPQESASEDPRPAADEIPAQAASEEEPQPAPREEPPQSATEKAPREAPSEKPQQTASETPQPNVTEKLSEKRTVRLDVLEALWTAYQFHYIDGGRVVSLDEGGITTSEGQGYAMLRAVWSNDPNTFERVWDWTKKNLRVRGDHLFAWKWKDKVLDRHSATDADTDIALALLLASRRFESSSYESEAREVIDDIWNLEILRVNGAFCPIAGDWARREPLAELHVAYLAPYAYQEFAKVDKEHRWTGAVDTSYAILHWLYFDRGVKLPPEKIWVDAKSGALQLEDPQSHQVAAFGYDAFPIFWRVALDASWNWRFAGIDYDLSGLIRGFDFEPKGEWKQQLEQAQLHERMLAPLRAHWLREQKIYDRYTIDGQALSDLEALPLYATAHSLA